ncbi:MAG: lyase family protein [Candidatus Azambacteria bacterium]|nr:lyase family protein [Candidatus Azambacteria bacterium]
MQEFAKKRSAREQRGQVRGVHESISPADHRYYVQEVADRLSSEAFLGYLCMVEIALVKVLHNRGLCAQNIVEEVVQACEQVGMDEVAAEEVRTKHDVRAVVNCIQKRLSDEAKRFVHCTATSYDIIDTARALSYRDTMQDVVIPELLALEETLIKLALREADTTQIGRTHGQHAVPITFGFSIASYVNRLGGCIVQLRERATELRGKFSGAVGAYNASTLFFENPELFEEDILKELGISPALCSTQIAPPEPIIRLMQEAAMAAGVMANVARDMRNLQRTEIAEVAEGMSDGQVGSSTMAHKQNPITFENIESMYKIVQGHMVTVVLDQVSEHQRDLTGSASARTYPEIINYVVYMARRLNRAMKKLVVCRESISRNLEFQRGLIVAEPLYLTLAALGHPDAHEKVRELSMRAREQGRPLEELAQQDEELKPYFAEMTKDQRRVFTMPERLYTGIAAQKAVRVAEAWASKLNITLS